MPIEWASTYRVVVYDSQIQREFLPGGDVNRHVHKWTREVAALVRLYAPVRTGTLKGSIHTDYSVGKNSTKSRVVARTHYALFVDQGTTGPIKPHGKYLALGKDHGLPKSQWVYRKSVAGQPAQHFMGRAMHDGMGHYI